MQREAMQHVDDPTYLRGRLKELLEEEEHSGMLNAEKRIRKKALQVAYETALKRQVHAEAEKKRREEAREEAGGPGVMDVSAIPLPSMPPPPASAPLAPPTRPPPGPPQQRAYVMKESSGAVAGSVVSGASTVVARPRAQHDVALTSLVPSTVARRPAVSAVAMRPRAAVVKAMEDEVPDNLDDFLKSL